MKETKSKTWGTEPHERLLPFPCDKFMGNSGDAYFRGVTINARPEIIFRWLCQMRAAPYSYDWIDNFGRQSPQNLIVGLEKLEIGQTVMFIFDLVDFEINRHITIRMKKKPVLLNSFGDLAVSYIIIPENDNSLRLLVKLVVRYPVGPVGWVMRLFLPWGDLIMMRRQLLNFKKLAERTQIEG